MKREINDSTYLKYLLFSLTVNELKQLCRDFGIKGFSKLKRGELVDFILDSLAEEEIQEVIKQKESEILNNTIDLALNKIKGKDRESLVSIQIVNQEAHEVELKFKGFNWEIESYLAIRGDNIGDPERDCDCRVGSNEGLCNHFWVGFIFSLKKGFFKLKDWTLTPLPKDFEKEIESIKLEEGVSGGSTAESSLTLVDEESDDFNVKKYLESSITVYDAQVSKITERESDFQGNITKFFLVDLTNVKFGSKLKKASDFNEDELELIDTLKVRISEKLQEENNLTKGNKIKFSGKLTKDNFWGVMVKNIRKIDRI